MLNSKINGLLNDQINKELYSAYLYLDMSNYFEHRGLCGFANWYYIQAQEERDHAMLIYKYLHNNGVKVSLLPISRPDKTFDSDLSVLQEALRHEEYVTTLIHKIYAETELCDDYRTREFISWFVTEQDEEETNARDMINKLELFGTDGCGLYLLNKELAKREYEAPKGVNIE